MHIAFDNSYARLPDRFFAPLAPTPVRAPSLIKVNDGLARDLGLDPAALTTPDGIAMLAGNQVPDGAAPLAQAYAGHQFGGWAGQLGDGRAIIVGDATGRRGPRGRVRLLAQCLQAVGWHNAARERALSLRRFGHYHR